jgi:hypothetical protein
MNYGNGGGAAGLHWNNDFNEWVIKDLITAKRGRSPGGKNRRTYNFIF